MNFLERAWEKTKEISSSAVEGIADFGGRVKEGAVNLGGMVKQGAGELIDMGATAVSKVNEHVFKPASNFAKEKYNNFMDTMTKGIDVTFGTDYYGDRLERKQIDTKIKNMNLSKEEKEFYTNLSADQSKIGGFERFKDVTGDMWSAGKEWLGGGQDRQKIFDAYNNFLLEQRKLILKDVEYKIQSGQISINDYESYVKKKLDEVEANYIMQNGLVNKDKMNDEEKKFFEGKSDLEIFRQASGMNMLGQNGRQDFIDKQISDKIDKRLEGVFEFDETDSLLTGSLNEFKNIENTLKEKLKAIDLHTTQSLEGLTPGTKEFDDIIKMGEMQKEARISLTTEIFNRYKQKIIDNPLLSKEDNINAAYAEAIGSLDNHSKVIIDQMDYINATKNIVANTQRTANNFDKANNTTDLTDKLSLYTSSMFNQAVGVGLEHVFRGVSEIGDIVQETASSAELASRDKFNKDGFWNTLAGIGLYSIASAGGKGLVTESGHFIKGDKKETITSNIKTAEDLKLAYDYYEYTMIGNNAIRNGLAHLFFNADDIAEFMLGGGLVGKGIKFGGAAVSKGGQVTGSLLGKLAGVSDDASEYSKFQKFLGKGVQNIKEAIDNNSIIQFAFNNKVINSTPVKFISDMGRTQTKKIIDDVVTNPYMNVHANNMMMQANNESNAVMDLMFDAIGGRVIGNVFQIGAGAGAKGVQTLRGKDFSFSDYYIKGQVRMPEEGITNMAAYNSSVFGLDAIFHGKDAMKAAENIAKSTGTTKAEAMRLIKFGKAMFKSVDTGKIKTSKELYDILEEAAPYVQANMQAVTNNAKLVQYDSIKRVLYKRAIENGKANIFDNFDETTKMNTSDLLGINIHLEDIKNIETSISPTGELFGYKLEGINRNLETKYKKQLKDYSNEIKLYTNKGDKAKLKELYKQSEKFISEILDLHTNRGDVIVIKDINGTQEIRLKAQDIEKLKENDVSIEDLVKSGTLINKTIIDKINEIKETNYTFDKNGNYKSYFNDRKVKEFPTDTQKGVSKIIYTDEIEELRKDFIDNGLDLKQVEIKIETKEGEKPKLENIYGAGVNVDAYFVEVKANINGKEDNIIVPGKRILDKINLNSFANVYGESFLKPITNNHTMELYNLAKRIGLNASNTDMIMTQAIEVFNIGKANVNLSKYDYNEMFNKLLKNFVDSNSLDNRLTTQGEEFKRVVMEIFKGFKMGDQVDLFILKTLIIKLGRNKDTFDTIYKTLTDNNRTLEDIHNDIKMFVGNETMRFLHDDLKGVFDLGDIAEEVDLVLKIDIDNLRIKKDKVLKDIDQLSLEEVGMFNRGRKKEIEKQIETLKAQLEKIEKTIALKSSDAYREKIINVMYSKSLKNVIQERATGHIFKMNGGNMFRGEIYSKDINGVNKVFSFEDFVTVNSLEADKKKIKTQEQELTIQQKDLLKDFFAMGQKNDLGDNSKAVNKLNELEDHYIDDADIQKGTQDYINKMKGMCQPLGVDVGGDNFLERIMATNK